MHLILPWAWPFDETPARPPVLPATPALAGLLACWSAGPRQHPPGEDAARSLNPPHEHALAQAWSAASSPCPDGQVPMAARWAALDGLDISPGNAAHWARVTPCHWQVGTSSTVLAQPAAPHWNEDVARTLFDLLAPLFAEETGADGPPPMTLHWGSASRWYIRHPLLAQIPMAALDRVQGQDVRDWLPSDQGLPEPCCALLRRLRRLQAEAQMLLYAHPAHDALERAGTWPVNTLWFSGSGDGALWQQAPAQPVQIDDTLSTAALDGDSQAWAAAWAEIDQRLAPLVQDDRLQTLTLCSGRTWRSWQRSAPLPAWNAPGRWLQRRRVARSTLLAHLADLDGR